MEEQLGRDYGNNNRAFLQAVMARGVLTFEDGQQILAAILNVGRADEEDEVRADQIDEDIFRDYLRAASAAASFFDYEIRTTVHQLTRKRVYAIVNTASDPQTQFATFYSPDELSFIKRVLDAMFDKFNTPRMEVMAITQMQAIKLARPPPPPQTQADDDDDDDNDDNDEATQTTNKDKGLKHSEVEEVLANLVDGGWFEKSRHNFYSLTSRGLLELRPWLTETFNDPDAEADDWQRIKLCEACRELLTIGLRCANPDCTFRIHDICQDAFWRARGTTSCPKCEKDWTGKNYVGERAVTQTEAYQKGRRRSGVGGGGGGGGASSSRGSAVQAESDDEDE